MRVAKTLIYNKYYLILYHLQLLISLKNMDVRDAIENKLC
jgi:hypothetical protein